MTDPGFNDVTNDTGEDADPVTLAGEEVPWDLDDEDA